MNISAPKIVKHASYVFFSSLTLRAEKPLAPLRHVNTLSTPKLKLADLADLGALSSILLFLERHEEVKLDGLD